MTPQFHCFPDTMLSIHFQASFYGNAQ